jgi:hypothetical protein
MEGLRAELAAKADGFIRPLVMDLQQLPLSGPEDVANLVTLCPRRDEAAIDAALEALDGATDGRLRIRHLGPLPPCSFAAVDVVPVKADRLATARRLLRVGDGQPATLRSAYHAAMRGAHPDLVGSSGTEESQALTGAFRLLKAAGGGDGSTICAVGPEDPVLRAA